MDGQEYSGLLAALVRVPDPRQARGKRFAWGYVLTLIAYGVACGQTNAHAIWHWVSEHEAHLVEHLNPARGEVPSEATIRRALQRIDVVALEASLNQPRDRVPKGRVAQAMDGKVLRGTSAAGRPTRLMGLVEHRTRMVRGQCLVEAHSSEATAACALVATRSLVGTVTTLDAGLAQRRLVRQITAQGGDYFAIIKGNQPEMREDIADLFGDVPLRTEAPLAIHRHTCKGHGRLETRVVRASAALNDYVRWPGVGQVVERTCRRLDLRTGRTQEATHYAVTSLTPAQATARDLETLWRGHWTIENGLHYVRDVTLHEDAHRAWRGNTPVAMAALRNAILACYRAAGWRSAADAVRHYASHPDAALHLVGATSLGL
jgi:predicted transposase YbfD/YdcC